MNRPSLQHQRRAVSIVKWLTAFALLAVITACGRLAAGRSGASGDSASANLRQPSQAVDVRASLVGNLVQRQDGQLADQAPGQLDAIKYYAFYYSASWCGPCRAFTPSLVKSYATIKAAHPEFELVFISADADANAMRDYMRADQMPWPALKFDQIALHPELMQYCGEGIPCLVFVDAQGTVLADTFVNGNYVGPQKVVTAIEAHLAQLPAVGAVVPAPATP